jgi:hypothetical protein
VRPLFRHLFALLAVLSAVGFVVVWWTRSGASDKTADGRETAIPKSRHRGGAFNKPSESGTARVLSEPSSSENALPRSAAADTDFTAFDGWIARYFSAAAAEREALIPEGVQLAEVRRAALAALIPSDPKQALDRAVPVATRQALPPDILARLEQRVNAKGFYGVLGVLPDPEKPAPPEPPIRREVRLGEGARYTAYAYGERLGQPTTENALLNGIAVDRVLALDERRLRVLDNGERPDPSKPIFTTCPISGRTVKVAPGDDGTFPPVDESTPAVEIGGEIHYICDGAHIHLVEEELVAAEGASGGPRKPTTTTASSQSTGPRTLLYVRVAFPDSRQEPQTETGAYELMRQVNDFLVENSYGNVYLLSTVTPLIILPRAEAWYKSGGGDEYDVRNDALAEAKLRGYDSGQYDLDVVVYTGGPGTFGGLGYVGSRGIWLKSLTTGVASHELGHNFGVWHANSWNTNGVSIIGDGSNLEYGNIFDTMGSANAGDKHFNANHKSQLNWLPQLGFVHRVTTSGLYRIHAFDQPRLDPANRYALKIDKDSDREYWAEFRQKSFSGNAWVRDGLFLNWSPWASSNQGAQLLDMTPGSPDDRNDAPLVIGRTFSDFESGIHLTPIGKGGTVPESMDVMVNLGHFPGNQPPIVSLAASAPNVGIGMNANFVATATDPNGDLLSYAWEFGDKTFSNTNSRAVSKAWSGAGDYVVRCVVSDMKGGTASDSVIVRVGSPGTFRVSGVITCNGQPLASVRVSNGATGTSYRDAFTNTDGTYTITGLDGGNFTVTPSLYGYSFAATFGNPLTVGPDFVSADFTAAQLTNVTLTISDPVCSEAGPNPGAFRLSRTGSTASALNVRFFSVRGTATKNADYTVSPDFAPTLPFLNATIPAGQSFVDLVVTPVNDTTAEGPETISLELAPGSGYVIAGSQVTSLVIEDDDTSVPVVSILVTDGDASEAGDTAAFLISRTGSTANPLIVRYSIAGTAAANSDYTSLGTQITIPAGASSVPLVVTPINDLSVEGTETVIVSLTNDPAYIVTRTAAQTNGTINILDDDLATITVSATDPSASENAGDTGTFVITRTGNTALALTVNYALGGSAAHGVDYAPLPGLLTLPAGSSVGSVTIVPLDDGLGEPQQTVSLQLRSGTGYIVGHPSLAEINLSDNSDPPIVTVGVIDGVAGEASDTGKFRFTTTGTGTGDIVVHYTVTGTAVSDVDYVALSGTVTMGRNTTADVTVTPLDDAELEGYESVTATINPDSSYSTFLDTTATINLADDDQPIVSVSTTVDYFTESSGAGHFWISRSGSISTPLTVNYALGGTATNGIDYSLLPGTLVIPANSTGALVNLTPINDTLAEGTETIVLTLVPGAYGIGIGSATHYMPDNDFPIVQVGFPTGAGSGSENVGTINIPVVLPTPSAWDVTVEYIIGGGTATGGVDYVLTPGLLTFPAGATQQFIPLTIVDDVYQEINETVMIRLINANGANLNGSNYIFTITNNDAAPAPRVGFAGTGSSGAESLSPAPIVVSLSAAQPGAVTVDYVVTGGTATVNSDYVLASGRLTFVPGETAKILPNSIVNDSDFEPDETIVITLSNPTGAALSANSQHTYTIIDDDMNYPPAITLHKPTMDSVTIPDGVGLILDASAIDDGKPIVPGVLTSMWTTISGPGVVTFGSAGSASTTATFSANGVYVVRLTASDGELAAMRDLTINVLAEPGWIGHNLGGATPPGSYEEAAGTFTVRGGGTDISGASDQFYLLAQTLTGDGEIKARIISMNGGTSASVGLMLRSDTSPWAKAALMSTRVNGASSFNVRATDGGDYMTSNANAAALPIWLRVSRYGVYVAGYVSSNGQNWTQVGATLEIAMDETVLAGLAITSGKPQALCPAVIDNVTVNGTSVNVGPEPNAGPDLSTTFPQPATLVGTITDDGDPAPPSLTATWTKVAGPGSVTFANPNALSTSVTFGAPGSYTLRLTGDDGQVATFDDVVVTTTAATVIIQSTDNTAAEQGPKLGVLTVARTGSTSGALLVHFQASGSAESGNDYQTLGGAVMIPVGAASAPIVVSPISDHLAEGDETVTLTLQPNTNYIVGAPAAASVSITDHPIDAWRLQRFGAEANHPLIGAESANPDGDPWNNLLEFALAADPLLPDCGLPSFALEGNDATLTYRRPVSAADLLYSIDHWTSAGAWEDAGFTEEILSDDGITRMVKDRVPLDGATSMTLRLRVTQPAQ